MGISGKSWRTLATAIAVPGAALGALAGFTAAPAMASTAHHQTPYRTETFHGYAGGENSYIPVYASGAFSDHGYIDLYNNGPGTTVHLSHGSLYVDTGNYHDSYNLSQQSCNETFRENFSYYIYGGSGRYYGVSGWGWGRIRLTAVVYRHNGTCEANDPIPNTIRITLDASGPIG